MGPWIPVDGGFLCDPRASDGNVVMNGDVAYWHSATDGEEYVLDLTDGAMAEAKRRNS